MKLFMNVYAKYNTNEKLFIPMTEGMYPNILSDLNKAHGGSWLLVDIIKPGEGIRFTDGQTYKGFSPEIDRYTDAIIKIF